MASEPLFEERSDAVKVSETPYPTNGSGKNLAENTGIKCIFLCTQACPYRLAGLALPSRTGEQLTTKEERIHVFLYKLNKKITK